MLHGTRARVILCLQVFLTGHTLRHILDQSCIIMLIRTDTVRQFVMEPPAFTIAAFQPPDQVPFLILSRFPMHPAPAVPVFKRTPAAWADTFFFTVYEKYLRPSCIPLHILI